MNDHKYRIGQRVAFVGQPGRAAARGDYQIVRLLPAEAGQYLYRIKSALEQWERVVTEDQIATRG